MSKPHKPSSLLIDLGGVLFYDEYVELDFYYTIFKKAQHYNPALTEHQFFLQREKLYPTLKNDWAKTWLSQTFPLIVGSMLHALSWDETLRKFGDLFKPYPSALFVLKRLSQNFRLFCVANQPPQLHDVLLNSQLTDYFEAFFIDSMMGYSKPDLRLFQMVLKSIGLPSKDFILIGDRFDNDILPALACGIHAIQLSLPVEPVSLPLIPHAFSERFYQSLQVVWHRTSTALTDSYTTAHSYEELLTHLQ